MHHARAARLDGAARAGKLLPDRPGAGVRRHCYELIHETRVIPLEPAPHVGAAIRLDMGDARGHWERETLVVETRNFKERSTYRNAAAGTLRLVERFTRTAPDRIEWAVTVDDPSTWTRAWTFMVPLTANTANGFLKSRATKAIAPWSTCSKPPAPRNTPELSDGRVGGAGGSILASASLLQSSTTPVRSETVTHYFPARRYQ